MALKQCSKCGEEQPFEEFYKCKRSPDGLRALCRSCSTALHREWVKAHPERAREINRAHAERNADTIREREAHKRAERPERHIWKGMNSRCYNPHNAHYQRYGSRGISVAPEWRGHGGFDRFFAHIGPRPTPEHSIDRYPNNDGNYEPGNVRWATPAEQMRNTSRTTSVSALNATRCVTDWAEESGVGVNTIRRRIERGVDPEEAVTRPARPKEHTITAHGLTMNLLEWSRHLGGKDSLVAVRLAAGWSEFDAVSYRSGQFRPNWRQKKVSA